MVVTVLTKRLELGFIREGHPLFTALVDTRLAFHSGCVAKVHGSRHPLPPLGSGQALVAPLKQGLRLVGQYSWPGPSTGARQRSLPRCMFVLRHLSVCHGSNSA